MKIFLILGAITFATVAHPNILPAVDSAVKSKSRTLQETIDLAIEQGSNGHLKLITAKDLGLDTEMTAKILKYSGKQAIDRYDHYLYVVYEPLGARAMAPKFLVWRNHKKTGTGPATVYDSYSFMTSLSGEIRSAIHGAGTPGNVTQPRISITSPGTLKRFEAEKRFFMNEAVRLEVNK